MLNTLCALEIRFIIIIIWLESSGVHLFLVSYVFVFFILSYLCCYFCKDLLTDGQKHWASHEEDRKKKEWKKAAEWEVCARRRIKSQRHEMWFHLNGVKHVRKWHRMKWTKDPPLKRKAGETLEEKEETKTSDWAEGEKKFNLLRLWLTAVVIL